MLPVLLFVLSAHIQHTFTGFEAGPIEVAFSPDSRVLATSSVDGLVKFWRISDHHLVRVLRQPVGVTSVQFSADGRQIATGSYDGIVRLWRGGVLVRSLKGHERTVWSVAFAPDQQSIASTGEDKTIRVWRVSDGTPLRTFARTHAQCLVRSFQSGWPLDRQE